MFTNILLPKAISHCVHPHRRYLYILESSVVSVWRVIVTSGFRTPLQQGSLKKTNRQNADAGQSKHNFGKAIDINLYKKSWFSSTQLMQKSLKKEWENSGILKIAQKNRLKWGGNFKFYYDPVHFETQ